MATTKSCEKCGKRFSARNKLHRFCNDDCRISSRREETDLNCTVCNSPFRGQSDRKTCSKLCAKVSVTLTKQDRDSGRLSDEDIIYLIMLNPGIGIKRFDQEVHMRKTTKKKTSAQFQYRVVEICNFYKEENNFDLYDLLQDPSHLTSMNVTDYLHQTGKERLPPGQGIGSGNRTALKIYRKDPGRFGNKNQRKVKVDLREFNWGRLAQSDD